MKDFPDYRKETLLQWAIMVKNSTPSAIGWSPFQAVFGKNPSLPSLEASNIAGLRENVVTRTLIENMNVLEQARVKFNEALAVKSLKKMIKARVRRNQTVFREGDHVFWKAVNDNGNWRQGKVLAVDGKVMWIRAGAQIYRVSPDMAVKAGKEFCAVDEKAETITR